MTKKNTFNFEAETSQLLDLLTHSIYSNKEIFIRELISNAADAIHKAKMKSLSDTKYLWEDTDLKITIDIDKTEKTITISDNGIGMTEEELKKNIGTIANSGTKKFLEEMKKQKEKWENNLIWQFGIGFYSVFMVADKVELETKSNDSKKSFVWISDGKWSYEIKEGKRKNRWTSIKIFLNKENEIYLIDYTLRELVKKYSNYVPVPIMMKELPNDDNKEKKRKYEQVNETISIWNKNKSEVKEEEYKDFYKSISFDFADPMTWLHLNLEWVVTYKSLLYIPLKKAMTMGQVTEEYWPKLYVQNVMILENSKELLPVWLRFVKWVVETNDLPLNVSREMLQNNVVLSKIRKWLTKKIIDKLKSMLNDDKYEEFLENYGLILKEGIYYDMENKEKIAEIVKFESFQSWKKITLDEYIDNLKWQAKSGDKKGNSDGEKKEIYYITWKSKQEVLSSPYLETFKDKGIDVLLMYEPIDEFAVQALWEYKNYKLISITSSDLELEEKTEEEKKKQEKKEEKMKDLFDFIKKTIWEDKLEEVKLSNRLKDSVWALATKSWGISPQMEKMMRAMGQPVPPSKRIFELNPSNKIVKLIQKEFKENKKSKKLKDLIMYSYEQAILAEWWELDNMQQFIKRVNKFIK